MMQREIITSLLSCSLKIKIKIKNVTHYALLAFVKFLYEINKIFHDWLL
jgi:hypothetical protein